MDIVSVHGGIAGAAEHQVIHNLDTDSQDKLSDEARDACRRERLEVRPPHLHAEHSATVTLQRAQEQAALSIAHADFTVVGANQQHLAGPLKRRAQAADTSRAVALKHILLLQSLMKKHIMRFN